jgi:hypothetical protein
MKQRPPLECATDTPIVMEAIGEHGRKYWAVRGNSGYFLFRRSLLTASENELSAAEKIVDVMAQEIMRLQAPGNE